MELVGKWTAVKQFKHLLYYVMLMLANGVKSNYTIYERIKVQIAIKATARAVTQCPMHL